MLQWSTHITYSPCVVFTSHTSLTLMFCIQYTNLLLQCLSRCDIAMHKESVFPYICLNTCISENCSYKSFILNEVYMV
jgi:hypothetical protein